MGRPSQLVVIEQRFGRSFRELVREQLESGRTTEEVAAYLGVPYGTLRYLLLREGGRLCRTVRFPEDRSSVSS